MSADIEVSKGIVVNPGRMGGTPTIKGRRISAAMVADYAQGLQGKGSIDGAGIECLVYDYDLSYIDIANARGWDRKGRPGEAPA